MKAQRDERGSHDSERTSDFQSQADAAEVGLVREFYDFLKANKKWWLSPILIAIGLLTFFVALSLSPAAPFIYTLF